MKSSARNIKMKSFDELFETGDPVDSTREKILEIPLNQLFPFKEHPFKVLEDESMQDMVESIKKYGVLVPAIARPRGEGGYELISGHRRKHASELAGKDSMPVLVRELDDDEAVLSMVDSNLQRENILPSEKAWAYKMKLDAIRRKAGRPAKGNSCQVGEKYSAEILSENSSDSARNIHRYIRLTELIPVFLQMADDRKLPFNPAVELSYLQKNEQEEVLKQMDSLGVVPSLEQARRLKQYSQEGKLNAGVIEVIFAEKTSSSQQITLKRGRLKEYFPGTYTVREIEDVIFSLLDTWKSEHA